MRGKIFLGGLIFGNTACNGHVQTLRLLGTHSILLELYVNTSTAATSRFLSRSTLTRVTDVAILSVGLSVTFRYQKKTA